VPLLDEIELHLDGEDASLRQGRSERTIFLMRLGYPEQGFIFLNGENSVRPWEELRTAYIQGCFQAAVLIGQCFLENLLGGLAHFSDKADGRPGLGDLLTVARDDEWLLESEFNEFSALAKLRNPYAHYRSFHPLTAFARGLRGLERTLTQSFKVTVSGFCCAFMSSFIVASDRPRRSSSRVRRFAGRESGSA
jgi:hypothetical protein